MPKNWLTNLSVNPIPALLEWDDAALTFFVNRDLLVVDVDPIKNLWDLPEAVHLTKRQQENGAWKYPGKTINLDTGTNYYLLETYRALRVLVENYGFNHQSSTMVRAVEFLCTTQTKEGDFRGILGNQYMPYYHGAILELLIKAGFGDDTSVKRGLDWLLSVRQNDGGWIIPALAVPAKQKTNDIWLGPPLPPDRSLPHAHLATGMVLRAFSVHPAYRDRVEIITAGKALKSRLFKADKYYDRKAKSYWFKFQYPFWWTSLVSALDTLSQLNFNLSDPDIARGLEWFIQNQDSDGMWPTGYGSGKKSEENRRWVGLAICRVLKRYYQGA